MSDRAKPVETIPRDLGGGLILRQATAEDTEAAAEFQSLVHAPPGTSGEEFRIWTRDLMRGALPGFPARRLYLGGGHQHRRHRVDAEPDPPNMVLRRH